MPAFHRITEVRKSPHGPPSPLPNPPHHPRSAYAVLTIPSEEHCSLTANPSLPWHTTGHHLSSHCCHMGAEAGPNSPRPPSRSCRIDEVSPEAHLLHTDSAQILQPLPTALCSDPLQPLPTSGHIWGPSVFLAARGPALNTALQVHSNDHLLLSALLLTPVRMLLAPRPPWHTAGSCSCDAADGTEPNANEHTSAHQQDIQLMITDK